MRKLRGQFSKVFKTREGHKFLGELSDPVEKTTPSDFRPRRFMSVSKLSSTRTGDVITSDGASFLIALSSTFSETLQFRCFEITHKVSWARNQKVVDPLTGLDKEGAVTIIDPALPLVVEYGTMQSPLGMENPKYKVLTGADVKVGDRLGAWIVASRREAYGLNLLEVA